MQIERIAIHNYRSIADLTLECGALVTLLGPNNHGKSNVLCALEFALSTSAKPVIEDFFLHRGSSDDTLWVEITFSKLTDQEANTFKRYVLSNNTIQIRKTAQISDGAIDTAYNGWIEQPTQEWLQTDHASEFTGRDKVKDIPLIDFVPASGRITKANTEEAQQKFIEQNRNELEFAKQLETGPLLGQKNVGGGVLPEFFLIPAVRDLTDEIKVKSTTTFGRLMNRAVREMAERDPRFIEARQQLETVITSLNARDTEGDSPSELAALEKSIEGELAAWGVSVDIEVTPPELERLFELGTDIQLHDGVRTTADRKGHGLQHAMIFALFRSWAATLRADRAPDATGEVTPRKQSDSVIFAMEEPELFLHPHAQRRLSDSLREIAETPQHQVFLCTHSTHFVDLARYNEVAIVTKSDPKEGSSARQCTEDLFAGEEVAARKKRFHMAQWINPDRGEMFFARQVVFVEGETEKMTIPYLGKKLGLFDADVSLIDCGAKHNLPLYIVIAKAFGIPYLVVHDEDPLPDAIPDDWSEDKTKQKRRTFEKNNEIQDLVDAPLGSVVVLAPDFEGASGVSKSQGDKKGKALAALEHFEAVEVDDVPDVIKDLVAASYSA